MQCKRKEDVGRVRLGVVSLEYCSIQQSAFGLLSTALALIPLLLQGPYESCACTLPEKESSSSRLTQMETEPDEENAKARGLSDPRHSTDLNPYRSF